MKITKTQAAVLAVAKSAGLFRADIFAAPAARKAVSALASKGLLASYGSGNATQYRVTRAGHDAT